MFLSDNFTTFSYNDSSYMTTSKSINLYDNRVVVYNNTNPVDEIQETIRRCEQFLESKKYVHRNNSYTLVFDLIVIFCFIIFYIILRYFALYQKNNNFSRK